MRITVVAYEFPYPPVHGGRSDVWQRLLALKAIGIPTQLVTWYSDNRGGKPTESQMHAVRQVVDDLIVIPIDLTWYGLMRRLVFLPVWPSHVTARVPRATEWGHLQRQVEEFAPTLVIQDGLMGGVTADRLAQRSGAQRWVRSHNVEHFYMKSQVKLERSIKAKIKLSPSIVGLKRFEQKSILTATGLLDISSSDLEFWKSQGVRRAIWLPPITALKNADVDIVKSRDVVYVGNLHTPNNVQGLLWFINEVWPKIHARNGKIRCFIAGSKPSTVITEAIDRSTGIELMPDPVDVLPIYQSAKVLINPVLAGSGVNVKSIEMLQMDAPIVSTPIGAGGLPPEVRNAFHIAEGAEDFCNLVCNAVVHGDGDKANWRVAARARFQPKALLEVFRQMNGN